MGLGPKDEQAAWPDKTSCCSDVTIFNDWASFRGAPSLCSAWMPITELMNSPRRSDSVCSSGWPTTRPSPYRIGWPLMRLVNTTQGTSGASTQVTDVTVPRMGVRDVFPRGVAPMAAIRGVASMPTPAAAALWSKQREARMSSEEHTEGGPDGILSASAGAVETSEGMGIGARAGGDVATSGVLRACGFACGFRAGAVGGL